MKNIIFDLGGVLIDWNPRYLYRKIFNNEVDMEHFLAHICTSDWNTQQDAGRSFKEGVAELLPTYPDWASAIRAYDERWEEMLAGPIEGTVQLLQQIHQAQSYRLLALSNWAECKFPIAEKNFPFLKWFEGIVVSGRVKQIKPNPEIYHHMIRQYQIHPEESVFIDDVEKNIQAAQQLGFHGILFQSPEQLKTELAQLHVL